MPWNPAHRLRSTHCSNGKTRSSSRNKPIDNPVFVEDLVRSCLQSLPVASWGPERLKSKPVVMKVFTSMRPGAKGVGQPMTVDLPSAAPPTFFRGFPVEFLAQRAATCSAVEPRARSTTRNLIIVPLRASRAATSCRELASDLANTLGLETNLVALRAGHLPKRSLSGWRLIQRSYSRQCTRLPVAKYNSMSPVTKRVKNSYSRSTSRMSPIRLSPL